MRAERVSRWIKLVEVSQSWTWLYCRRVEIWSGRLSNCFSVFHISAVTTSEKSLTGWKRLVDYNRESRVRGNSLIGLMPRFLISGMRWCIVVFLGSVCVREHARPHIATVKRVWIVLLLSGLLWLLFYFRGERERERDTSQPLIRSSLG